MIRALPKILIIAGFIFTLNSINSIYSTTYAQANSEADNKQATQSEVNEGITNANKVISELTKKIYAKSLFSPDDNNNLIELKLTLYDLWTKNPTNRELAKPMYETAILLRKRELIEEAKDFLVIVIENFPPDEEEEEETISIDYSSKAQSLLDQINKNSQSN
jgi:hypothetical protein